MLLVPGREAVLKLLVVALALTTLAYAEYVTWNDTVEYVSNQMVRVIQSDNTPFLALGR